jgi:membrane associated rhomboid family serine protease
MQPLPLATIAVLLVTAWVTWRAFQQPALFERLKFRPDRVLHAKEYYRLVSSALLHVDWTHFFFNAITLVAFGDRLEKVYGIDLLLIVYLGSVVGGSLLSLVIHRNHDYSAVGASGGVCGVLFAHIFLFPGSEVGMILIPIYIPAWAYAVLYLGYTFSGMYRNADNIGHDAHLGGALVGLGIATAAHPAIVMESPRMLAAVVGLTVIFFVLLARSPHSSLRTLFAPGPKAHAPNQRYQQYDEGFNRANVKGRLDELLDKVARGGIHRLTPAERRELERLSQELKK